MSDPNDPDGLPRPISWGEWRELKARVKALEAALAVLLPGDELVPLNGTLAPITPRRQIRATRLPEGWVPHDSTIAKMSDELRVNGEALHRAHLKFVDHFLSAPGQKGVKVDWDRTWCNWMRTEAERGTLLSGRTGTVADKAQGWMELGNAGSN